MSKTILENTSAQIVEKKSKFIANIYYVQSQEEVENILKETRKVETLHELIKNNGQNFNITEAEKNIIENFAQ